MSSLVKLNFKIIFHLMGLLIMVNGGFMLLATLVSFYYKDGVEKEMLEAGLVTLLLGLILMLLTRNRRKEIQKRGAVDGDLYMMKDGEVVVPYARIIIKNKTI